jgi:hypothetical protein
MLASRERLSFAISDPSRVTTIHSLRDER